WPRKSKAMAFWSMRWRPRSSTRRQTGRKCPKRTSPNGLVSAKQPKRSSISHRRETGRQAAPCFRFTEERDEAEPSRELPAEYAKHVLIVVDQRSGHDARVRAQHVSDEPCELPRLDQLAHGLGGFGFLQPIITRSEERRVGQEGRAQR